MILKQTKFITQDVESRLCVLTVYAVFTVKILFTLSFMITPRIVAMMIMRTVKQKAGLHQHRIHRKGNDNDEMITTTINNDNDDDDNDSEDNDDDEKSETKRGVASG